MNKRRIRGFDMKIPNADCFPIKTKPNMVKAPFVTVACASRGGGKTTSIVNLARRMMLDKTLDRVFLICPTYHSNRSTYDMIESVLDEDDIYEDPTFDSLIEVKDKIQEEADDLEEYLAKMERYKEMMKEIADGTDVSDHSMLEFYSADGGETFDPPTHRWGGRKPILLLICDDTQSTKILSPASPLMRLVTTHRHQGLMKEYGTALGLSIIICVQNYGNQGYGINKAIRGNMTNMMVFRQKDKTSLDKIQKEMGAVLDEETFRKLYDEGTKDKYGFLFIDFFKKDNHPSSYRKNFNEFLVL